MDWYCFQNRWLIEMSEGLPNKCESNVEDDDENSDNQYRSTNPPVENKKKTLKQRRKQKEQMKLKKSRNTLKKEKKKITDIHELQHLKEQIETLEVQQQISREKRKKKMELAKKKTKILGSLKYETPEIEFHMAQELSGNLKNLKVEGNILTDRFKSMEKRNILVPSKRHIHKRPKVKKYIKPGHKDEDWKKTVAR